jgi:very-short-patch-repair endonuclease
MTRSTTAKPLVANARKLRRDMTDAERLLWAQLRGHRLTDLHFRRQVPLGPFIVDFVAHEPKVVVELDGSHHAEHAHALSDVARDAWLVQQGYLVLRFWNHEIFTELEVVKATIYARCVERLPANHPLNSPPSQPSPTRGEG